MEARSIRLASGKSAICYILLSLDGLFDHTISISRVLEPSLPPSWLRLKNPLYTPSVTTLSIWMVTLPSVDCNGKYQHLRNHTKESQARSQEPTACSLGRIWLISQQTIFFSHTKPANSTFSHGLSQTRRHAILYDPIPFQMYFCFCI